MRRLVTLFFAVNYLMPVVDFREEDEERKLHENQRFPNSGKIVHIFPNIIVLWKWVPIKDDANSQTVSLLLLSVMDSSSR